MALGRVDVDRMLEEMTPEQLFEWIAYTKLEPIGTDRIVYTLARGFTQLMNQWATNNPTAKQLESVFHAIAGDEPPDPEVYTPDQSAAMFSRIMNRG